MVNVDRVSENLQEIIKQNKEIIKLLTYNKITLEQIKKNTDNIGSYTD